MELSNSSVGSQQVFFLMQRRSKLSANVSRSVFAVLLLFRWGQLLVHQRNASFGLENSACVLCDGECVFLMNFVVSPD